MISSQAGSSQQDINYITPQQFMESPEKAERRHRRLTAHTKKNSAMPLNSLSCHISPDRER